jgi:hypothetical protein
MSKQIAALARMRNGTSGNPVFEVTFEDGQVARTATDSQVGHSIENSEYQGVPVDVTWRDGEIVGVTVA